MCQPCVKPNDDGNFLRSHIFPGLRAPFWKPQEPPVASHFALGRGNEMLNAEANFDATATPGASQWAEA